MSAKYNKVKQYYDMGVWSTERVRNAVIKGWITEEEFQGITGSEDDAEADAPAPVTENHPPELEE